MVPPGEIGERADIDLVSPSGAMLFGEVHVRLGDVCRQNESVMLVATRFTQVLEALGPEHFAERVRRVHRSIDDNVGDVDSLGSELCIEGLAQHVAPAHRRRV